MSGYPGAAYPRQPGPTGRYCEVGQYVCNKYFIPGYPSGGAPPGQGGYPGARPPAQGGYPGGAPPAQGGYPGGAPPGQGGYPGQSYEGAPAPSQSYGGGPAAGK